LLIRWRFAGDDLHRFRWDRLVGAALAGMRMSVSLYLALCMVSLVRRELRFRSAALEQSALFSLANGHNLFVGHDQFLASAGLGGHSSLFKVQEARAVEMLKASPELREILNRPELKEALKRGDAKEIVKKVLEESAKDHRRVIDKSVSEP
jgi:hypothetical protein